MDAVKTKQEISFMRQGGLILRETLRILCTQVRAGTKCSELDRMAGELLKERGAVPSFLNYQGFPANLCISINDELVHGIPGKKIIKPGDIVSLDLGVKYKGMFTDAAVTVGCDPVSPEAEKIMRVCRECLRIGVSYARSGVQTGDLGFAIQSYAEKNGYGVVRKLVGHGVGHSVHEDLKVPNYGVRGEGVLLKKGMTLAIEPMISVGTYDVEIAADGWTFVTKDRKLSCHFEHTVVVGTRGGEVIT